MPRWPEQLGWHRPTLMRRVSGAAQRSTHSGGEGVLEGDLEAEGLEPAELGAEQAAGSLVLERLPHRDTFDSSHTRFQQALVRRASPLCVLDSTTISCSSSPSQTT